MYYIRRDLTPLSLSSSRERALAAGSHLSHIQIAYVWYEGTYFFSIN